MTLSPSISLRFDGHCEEAFMFYERCLGGRVGMVLTWGDSPMATDAPPDWRQKVLHASLTVGDVVLAGSDVLPGQYRPPRGFGVLLGLGNRAEAERIFDALAEGGLVTVALQQTFWADRFGGVTDRFGIPWEINCERAV